MVILEQNNGIRAECEVLIRLPANCVGNQHFVSKCWYCSVQCHINRKLMILHTVDKFLVCLIVHSNGVCCYGR